MKALMLASSLVASAPTSSDTFAIACSGAIFNTSLRDGKTTETKFSLPDQIFVFSEMSNVALRAMPRRQEFENICEIGAIGKKLDFSSDLIRTYWVSPTGWDAETTCEFKFNRTNNSATLRTKFEWSSSTQSESEWRMACAPTEVPIFDIEERSK
ncbi:hypothetical protein [uncultured Sphingorhabdus sp.]|jgi:hypothetical protein|uniref:hypothetical protein n=1 Tax=uncultured Sphingorhabdus sp. TaxID=1686106 RepID=UPI00260C7195|nr:hypothetical protein [uncultured Sphingorhabdus sp.]HMS21479.1 hypothetical protein [Sphingorhabdus sp.]